MLLLPTTCTAGATWSVKEKVELGRKVTDVVFETVPPVVAVICAVPASVEVMEDVAAPFIVVTVGDTTLPRSLVKVTRMPLATALLYWSRTVAVSTLLWPTTSEAGLACSARVAGTSGAKVTVMVPCAEALVAVIKATPACVELMEDAVAPLNVVPIGGETLPMLLVNETGVPLAT